MPALIGQQRGLKFKHQQQYQPCHGVDRRRITLDNLRPLPAFRTGDCWASVRPFDQHPSELGTLESFLFRVSGTMGLATLARSVCCYSLFGEYLRTNIDDNEITRAQASTKRGPWAVNWPVNIIIACPIRRDLGHLFK